jgi:DNA ligase-1
MSNTLDHAPLNALQHIANTPGRNDKEALLKKYADLKHFKELLQFAFDPYIRTGIGLTKLSKVAYIASGNYIDYDELINYFKLHGTGSGSDVYYAKSFVSQYVDGSVGREIAIQIVTKTLKIGVTAKTLNKVFGKTFIPLIGIMRAETYDDFKGKVGGPFIATEKIDGVRRLLIKENGKISMYSRSGIPDEGLVDIEAEAVHLPNDCVFDGELKAIGDFDNALELRQATTSIANSNGVRHGLTFNIFDIIPLKDYKNGKSTHDARSRKILLSSLFGDVSMECIIPQSYKRAIEENQIKFDFEFIKVVPIEGVVNTEAEILLLAEPIWRRGFEGLMLSTYKGLYDFTKTKSREILKVKNVEEHVLTVIDMEIGKRGTKNEGRLGALILDYKGYRIGCGSGLNDKQRDEWWKFPDRILGKKIEIECYGESTNKQDGLSLNCPIFKRVVGTE